MLQVKRIPEAAGPRFSGLLQSCPGFGAAIWEKRVLEQASWDWGCYLAFQGGHAAALTKGEGYGICCGSLKEKALIPFFQASGVSLLTCPQAKPGGADGGQWGMVMGHPGGKEGPRLPEGDCASCYYLLRDSVPALSVPFARYYWEMKLRHRKGVGQLYRLEEAMAFLSFTPFGVLLSQVATAPYARGQGQCSRLLTRLCAGVSGPIYLFCLPELAGFYENLSFSTIGYWRNLLL